MAQTFVPARLEVDIEGLVFKIAPLTLLELQQIESLQNDLKSGAAGWTQYLSTTTEMIEHAAARAGLDPEIVKSLRQILTVESWGFVWNKLLALSGLRLPGEAMPAAGSRSTGENSTPESSPLPAGQSAKSIN